MRDNAILPPTASGDGAGARFVSTDCVRRWRWCALLCATAAFAGNFEDYIRFLSCHLFGPVNHGQTWKGWERSGEKGLIISDNQAQTWLIITINDTSIGDLPLIITISDTCKNQPKRLDFDNTINLSSLIVSLVGDQKSDPKDPMHIVS